MFKIKNKNYKIGDILHGWQIAGMYISIEVIKLDKEYAYCMYWN